MKAHDIEVVISGDEVQLIQDNGDSMIVFHVDQVELVQKWIGDAADSIRTSIKPET